MTKKNIFSSPACVLIQTQQILGRLRINYLIMNRDIVKVYSGVENTSEKITYNHYTEIIFKDLGNCLVTEYICALEY